MGIKMTTPQGEIDKEIATEIQRFYKAAINILAYCGEDCVNKARLLSQEQSYTDQTGNLRSSIGYIVTVNGEVVAGSSFDIVEKGAQGSEEGKKYIKSLIKSNDMCLIVVAGMKYAAYVESLDNHEVLRSAEEHALMIVPKMMDQLGKK